MERGTITMSIAEVEKLKIYQQLDMRLLKQRQAASMLGIGVRQVKAVLRQYRLHGPSALVSKKVGKKSNRAYSDDVKNNATAIIRDKYTDFGPQLASEYLLERHNLKYSKETLRLWMIDAGIWIAKKEKQK